MKYVKKTNRVFSQETRDKMSIAKTGHIVTPEHASKLKEAMTKRHTRVNLLMALFEDWTTEDISKLTKNNLMVLKMF